MAMRMIVLGTAWVWCCLVAVAAAQTPLAALEGRWTLGASADCRARFYALSINGDEATFTDERGRVNVERIIDRRGDGFTTATVASAEVPAGTRWDYAILGPDRLRVANLSTGRTFQATRCGASLPAAASPEEFLRQVYGLYGDGAGPGSSPFAGAANVQRYFSPRLAALLIADQRRADQRGEVGCLNADPIADGQDYRISRLLVRVESTSPDAGRAVASASFLNFGRPSTVLFDLVRAGAGWRIDDVRARQGGSLRAFLAECARQR